MREPPHPNLLNRAELEAQAALHLANQIGLLTDLANYGSNLVVRAYNSSPKKVADIIVCGVLLKQIVSMLDATQILLAAGNSHAAFLPARSAWEASVYIDWILSGDNERRASCYLVGNFREERSWASRVTPSTPEEAIFSKITDSIGLDILANHPNITAEANAHLAEVNRILSQPLLKTIDYEFQMLRGKKKRDPEWYELDGMKSIRQIAEAVGRLAEYECFYSKGSQVTHTGNYRDHVLFKDDQIRFKPIRHLEPANMLLNFAVPVALGTYKRVLLKYRPGEIAALTQKYRDEWRDPFINIPSFKYDFSQDSDS